MKILFLSSGYRVPSSRFRVLPYISHLRSAGHTCTVLSSFPQKYDFFPKLGFRPSQLLKRVVRLWHLLCAWIGRYDVVIIDRELFDDDTSSMELRFRRVSRTLVLDVDDAVFLRYPQKFEQLARMSDLVIAGNRFLKERIVPMNPKTVIIPTCVDTDSYRVREASSKRDGPVVVGWVGTTGNLENLRLVAPALRELATRCEFELRLIASEDTPLKSIDLSGVNLNFVHWGDTTAIEQLSDFDIGIMPLDSQSEWNTYKCGLKLLQYMAIGIPGVASPVGVSAEIVDHGRNGFLANNTDDWTEILFRLIQKPELRYSIGAEGRRTAEQRYSIQAHFPRLIRSLEAAIAGEQVADI
jgi:glycosyltransferase involved in cell wall biosynthesis